MPLTGKVSLNISLYKDVFFLVGRGGQFLAGSGQTPGPGHPLFVVRYPGHTGASDPLDHDEVVDTRLTVVCEVYAGRDDTGPDRKKIRPVGSIGGLGRVHMIGWYVNCEENHASSISWVDTQRIPGARQLLEICTHL